MSRRFIDNEQILKESLEFVPRNSTTPLWWLVMVFVVGLLLISLSMAFAEPYGIWVSLLTTFVVMAALLFIIYLFILKDRNVVAATELQNSIFSGVARLSSKFSLIIRHDGVVAYIDPEYNRKHLRLDINKINNVEDLYDHGALNKKEKNRLLSALVEGRKETINFSITKTREKNRPMSFSLTPIGVYDENREVKRISLTVCSIERPSGYFFLRAHEDHEQHNRADYIQDLLIGTYSIKKNGEFIEVNDNLLSIIGYEREEFFSENLIFSNIFKIGADARKIVARSTDFQGVVFLKDKQDKISRFFISHRPSRDPNGKVIERCGLLIPFYESAASKKSGLSNANASDFINNSPIATAILDVEGLVMQSNSAFKEFAHSANIKGRKWHITDIMGSESIEPAVNIIAQSLKNDSDEVAPIDIKIKDEEGTSASLYISKVKNQYGDTEGIIAHFIDTTELKNLELRFVHSQKMQAIGQLAGGIAHDFNNLLTAMMGFCDLLLIRHPAGDQSFADIMQIKQNANRAANLVRQLLAFSRKQTLQPKVIDITDALADLSNLIGRLIGENIALNMVHGRDLNNIKVDQVQLEQVIVNLAVNARDAMNDMVSDGGTLTIRTSNVSVRRKNALAKNLIPPAEDEVIEKGDYVLIEVIDTGCGMEEAQIGKIFEPFFSTKEVGEGTGLGLATVYGIVKQTDGYIYVSSKVSEGTNFSIFLKAYKENLVKKQNVIIDAKSESLTAADLSGTGTILLVEDETPVRIFSNSALVNKGYSVLEAENAEIALQIVKERGSDIDLIITDVVMPGMSGPDMVKEVTKTYPDIKVVFISGYGEDAFVETYGDDRKFNFLSKPYSLKQLATKVKEVLGS